MKSFLIVLLTFISIGLSAQDWSITTTKMTKWTVDKMEPYDSSHIIFHTATITKKGDSIVFLYNGNRQVRRFTESKKFPALDERSPFDDRDGSAICYYTQNGMIIYFINKKKVMCTRPDWNKYVYF